MPPYSPRKARKGLTADGSTRAWRKLRDAIPGPKPKCRGGKPPHAHHIKPRRLGGQDVASNVEWRCGENDPYVGRPRGS